MEEKLRDLRLQLKTAQNDVKRYASYALRLQQDLAREKQNRKEQDNYEDIQEEEDARFVNLKEKYIGPPGTFVWDKKVDQSRKNHVAWSRKIDHVVQMLNEKQREAAESKESANSGNQAEEKLESVVQSLVPFLLQQKSLIEEVGRENAKLRDMVHARPTRRELVTSQLDVERLQKLVQKLRARSKRGEEPTPRSQVQQEQQSVATNVNIDAAVKETSLSERIVEERLLQMLHVKTENSTTHHKYLKKKMHCYLTLDSAKLASHKQDLTETNIQEWVGRICSDIVASCCYILDVEDVGELPNCAEKAQQLSNVSTAYQAFVERIEKLLKRFDKDAFYSARAQFTADTSCHEALERILAHVNDVLVELDARREQMKPPGSKAHQILLANMKLLQVARVDQLVPTIRRLVDNMRAEQDFQRGLRELFGLDEAANRKQIMQVATILFGELGFLTGNTSTTLPTGSHPLA